MDKNSLLAISGAALVLAATTTHAQSDLGAGPAYVKNKRYIHCTAVNAGADEEIYTISTLCASPQDSQGVLLGSAQTQILGPNESYTVERLNKGGRRTCWCKVVGDADPDAAVTMAVFKKRRKGKAKKPDTYLQGQGGD